MSILEPETEKTKETTANTKGTADTKETKEIDSLENDSLENVDFVVDECCVWNVSEEQARHEPYCRGCREKKEMDLIVCWRCFKYRENSLKYFRGTFQEWLQSLSKKGSI